MKKPPKHPLGSTDSSLTPDPAPARPDVRAAHTGRTEVGTDAPPSNTASNNCNQDIFQPLRWGVDSLYLSYPGELQPGIDTRLKALKLLAQSADPDEQSQAQYPLGDHLFEVNDKAPKGFAYVLEDGAFRIQLSRSIKLPAAYVKISAEYLAHVGPVKAEQTITDLLSDLVFAREAPNVSRIDLFIDFVWTGDMEWGRECWITRGGSIDAYSENGVFTGWVVGRGGILSARLYYKLLHAVKTQADYLVELWQRAGWNGEGQVWRLEFQLRRELLSSFDLRKLPAVLSNLNGLWSYATTEWLRLALPNPEDQTRSRWPVHPLWLALSSVDWETPGGPLTRTYDPARLPQDERLFGMVLSLLVSYMARERITDAYQGWESLQAAFYDFHNRKAQKLDLTFDAYLDQKLGVKTRLFNTLLNDPKALQRIDEAAQAQALADQAEAYRKARDGE